MNQAGRPKVEAELGQMSGTEADAQRFRCSKRSSGDVTCRALNSYRVLHRYPLLNATVSLKFETTKSPDLRMPKSCLSDAIELHKLI